MGGLPALQKFPFHYVHRVIVCICLSGSPSLVNHLINVATCSTGRAGAFPTPIDRTAVPVNVDAIAKQASEDAKDAYGQQCLDELARCDERGEDVDALPEVDGEAEFFVIVEERSGQAEERGDRHWE